MHADVIKRLANRISVALRKQHELNPLRSMIDRKSFLSGFDYLGETALVEAVIDRMKSDNLVRLSLTGIGLTDCGPKLSKNEQALLNNIVSWFRGDGLTPPTVADCQKKATKNKDAVPQLINLAVNNGDLAEIDKDFYLHLEVLEDIKSKIRKLIGDKQQVTMADIRDCLGTTRKYAVPLCEYLDSTGFTKREGDFRVLATAE